MSILIVSLIAILLSPLIIKTYAILNIKAGKEQLELLETVAEKAVAHVHQVSLSSELSSEQKKKLAINIANMLAHKAGLDPKLFIKISPLIESCLWIGDEDTDLIDD